MIFTDNLNLSSARMLKKHYKFNSNDLPQIEWIDIVDCINYNVIHNRQIVTLENFGLLLLDLNSLSKIKEVFLDFCKLEPKINCSAHLYISLSVRSKTFGWHKDQSDVIFWQALGKTHFSIKEEQILYEYILQPSDLIYIPAGIEHCTIPLTPRAGISLGIDYV